MNSSSSVITRGPRSLHPDTTIRRWASREFEGQVSSEVGVTVTGSTLNTESSSVTPISCSPAAYTRSAGGLSTTEPSVARRPNSAALSNDSWQSR
jgi:hypothetical protein